MSDVATCPHQFHSAEYVAAWAKKVDNPIRRSVFHHILAHLHLELQTDDAAHVVELACGPGLLAEFLLGNRSAMTYEGLDFSAPMLAMAEQRLAPFSDRVSLRVVDLRDESWTDSVERVPRAVISTQALHDVGGAEEHAAIYRASAALLAPGGLLLNADFVDRPGTGRRRIGLARQLEMMAAAGLRGTKATLDLGPYACVVGFAPPG
ncbi:MAG: class I SAM-dependent methyltransferase [Gammaproteobacteria bacterium]|nr:class I SAM-dependent methyltransferase [Gammaproteobacteria bacterium]